MALDGTGIKQSFLVIPKNPVSSTVSLDLPNATTRDCCGNFSLKVLADINSTDDFRNDVSGLLWWFDPVITAATMKLLKWNGSSYAQVGALSSGTYGTFYDFEFFTNDSGENFIGYQLQWNKVINAFGEGSYKIRCSTVSSLAGNVDYDSQEYCLKQYTEARADVTVRIEYYLNGILGTIDNDEKTKDFGLLNWYNSFRLPGFFGFPSAKYTTEYIAYNTGQQLFVEDDQEPEYILKLKPIMYYLHEILRIDVMMADKILITDYNSKNPGTFIRKAVQKSSDYSPNWNKLKSKLASIELKFKQEFNNLKKFRD